MRTPEDCLIEGEKNIFTTLALKNLRIENVLQGKPYAYRKFFFNLFFSLHTKTV